MEREGGREGEGRKEREGRRGREGEGGKTFLTKFQRSHLMKSIP